ncbi:MAG TPA: DUF4476 domain-containing protein [Parafilimonas sp.]|nr:DUF4476 domain-containing protein [Parafilimonas sp.]
MNHSLKSFAFVFFFCINCVISKAQQKHFIYIQSEDKQQFAIVFNGKVYSSSDYGYIIIPKLADGDYNFTVSFPMNKFPDQAFSCTINKKDAGFFLKNGTDGWALQDMHTQKSVPGNSNEVAKQNAFGDMLSEVVNDSSLTQKNIPTDDNAGKVVAAAGTVAVAETFAITKSGDTLAVDNPALITDSAYQPEKISESKLDTGTNMLFVDKTQSGIDTINVFVPAEKTTTDATSDKESASETAANDIQHENPVVVVPLVTNDAASSNSPRENTATNSNSTPADNSTHEDVSNPFYKPEQNSKDTAAASVQPTSDNQASTVTADAGVNPDCTDVISDEELNKIKRKMFIQDNDNEMIQYALKYVNKKCITTDQVKILGSLFSSDDGRYNLYDAMYKHVYDYGNYPRLADLILDPYYKKRFAAMLR